MEQSAGRKAGSAARGKVGELWAGCGANSWLIHGFMAMVHGKFVAHLRICLGGMMDD